MYNVVRNVTFNFFCSVIEKKKQCSFFLGAFLLRIRFFMFPESIKRSCQIRL